MPHAPPRAAARCCVSNMRGHACIALGLTSTTQDASRPVNLPGDSTRVPIRLGGPLIRLTRDLGWFKRVAHLIHAPRTLKARKGLSRLCLERSWYQCARIDMIYNVITLYYMFDAFKDANICTEPYICVFLGYFFEYFPIFL